MALLRYVAGYLAMLVPDDDDGEDDDEEENPEPVTIEENDDRLVFTGTWNSSGSVNGGHSGGAEVYTTDGTVSLTFTGTSVQIIAYNYPNHGIADVYIDDVIFGSYNTIGESAGQRVVFSKDDLDPEEHAITIRRSSPDGYIPFDAFVVQ
jgi:hypothetical protein